MRTENEEWEMKIVNFAEIKQNTLSVKKKSAKSD